MEGAKSSVPRYGSATKRTKKELAMPPKPR